VPSRLTTVARVVHDFEESERGHKYSVHTRYLSKRGVAN
jgi:hypothetical protein